MVDLFEDHEQQLAEERAPSVAFAGPSPRPRMVVRLPSTIGASAGWVLVDPDHVVALSSKPGRCLTYVYLAGEHWFAVNLRLHIVEALLGWIVTNPGDS